MRQLSIVATLCWGQGSTLERCKAKLRWSNPWATHGCYQTCTLKPTPGVQGSQDPTGKLLAGHTCSLCRSSQPLPKTAWGTFSMSIWGWTEKVWFKSRYPFHDPAKNMCQKKSSKSKEQQPTSHMLVSIWVPPRHASKAHLNEFLRVYYSFLLTPGLGGHGPPWPPQDSSKAIIKLDEQSFPSNTIWKGRERAQGRRLKCGNTLRTELGRIQVHERSRSAPCSCYLLESLWRDWASAMAAHWWECLRHVVGKTMSCCPLRHLWSPFSTGRRDGS